MVFTLYWNDMGGEMCKCENATSFDECANVQMCKCANVQMCKCANVQMCKCANGRLLLLVALAANVLCY